MDPDEEAPLKLIKHDSFYYRRGKCNKCLLIGHRYDLIAAHHNQARVTPECSMHIAFAAVPEKVSF